jgi:hypothetical protein
VFAAVREVLIASVERHEVQHRIDAALAAPRPTPAELAEYVGAATGDDAERSPATRARDELSAYLAELARDRLTSRANLTLLGRFLFDRRSWGTVECYVALIIFQALGRELDVGDGGALVVHGEIDRERVARIYLALTLRSSAELGAAAQALWERLFAAPLPPLRVLW